jgi:hypothetical protein
MSNSSISPSLQWSRSALDHRAIDVAARLLVAGIWLERLLGNAPKILTTFPPDSGMHGLGAKVPRSSVLTPHQGNDEEPGHHSGC